jgi:hypothetical protein
MPPAALIPARNAGIRTGLSLGEWPLLVLPPALKQIQPPAHPCLSDLWQRSLQDGQNDTACATAARSKSIPSCRCIESEAENQASVGIGKRSSQQIR